MMLRPAGDMSGFGGRPPVNIQINFVPGDVSALKVGISDTKLLNAELERGNVLLRERNALLSQSVAPGRMPGGGGGGFSPTTVPGVPHPGSSGSAFPRPGGAPVVVLPPAVPGPAPASPTAPPIHPTSTPGSGVTLEVPGMSPIDRMMENARRRRQGLPSLVDPTIAGAAANVGVSSALTLATSEGGAALAGGGLGLAGGAALGGGLAAGAAAAALALHNLAMDIPNLRGALQDWEADIISRTSRQFSSEGTVGQIGSRLSASNNPLVRPIGDVIGAAGTAWGWALGGADDELIRTQDALSRQAQRTEFNQLQQGRLDARFLTRLSGQLAGAELGSLTSSPLFGGLNEATARRSILSNALSATAGGDPQAGFQLQGQSRVDALMQAKEAEVQILGYHQQIKQNAEQTANAYLNNQQQILALRQRELEVVKEASRTQIAGLAGLSDGRLRRVETAFNAAQRGPISERQAETLNAAGIQHPQVDAAFRAKVGSIAPNVLASIDQNLDRVKAQEAQQRERVEKFAATMESVFESMDRALSKMADEVVKKVTSLNAQIEDAKNQIIDESTARGRTQNRQAVRAPGVAG